MLKLDQASFNRDFDIPFAKRELEDLLADSEVWLFYFEDKPIGYYAFEEKNKDLVEIIGVVVIPEYQKQGIGKTLVNEGLSLLKAQGGKGCALVGDPGYYQRFGFRNIPSLIHEGVPQEVFLVLPFDKTIPNGTVLFHEGFLATG